LIELLVVIAIIAILAGILLPAILKAKDRVRKTQAQLDISQIVTAANSYETDYSRSPAGTAASRAAAATATGDDFTYGTFNLNPFKTPTGPYDISTPGSGSPASYQVNNSELMAVLMDLETYGNGQSTINKDHARNTHKNALLTAKMSGDTSSPGVGSDGVYRDPWGNPYIITLDLNNDEKCRDSFYRLRAVSQQQSGQVGGFFGLSGSTANPDSDEFEYRGKVMAWSAGPDKMIDPGSKANTGANKDNVLSWK
jgi:type II secretory pathway pseudopilin PulG